LRKVRSGAELRRSHNVQNNPHSTNCSLPWVTEPSVLVPPHYREFTITLRPTAIGRIPLEEWAARRRHLYLTPHNNRNRQTSKTQEFQSASPASERPMIQASDRVATGIGKVN